MLNFHQAQSCSNSSHSQANHSNQQSLRNLPRLRISCQGRSFAQPIPTFIFTVRRSKSNSKRTSCACSWGCKVLNLNRSKNSGKFVSLFRGPMMSRSLQCTNRTQKFLSTCHSWACSQPMATIRDWMTRPWLQSRWNHQAMRLSRNVAMTLSHLQQILMTWTLMMRKDRDISQIMSLRSQQLQTQAISSTRFQGLIQPMELKESLTTLTL